MATCERHGMFSDLTLEVSLTRKRNHKEVSQLNCNFKDINETNLLRIFSVMRYVKSVQIRSFFWSLFSRIRTEYGNLLRKSPYSVRIRKIQTRKNSVFGHFSHSDAF